MTRSNRFGFYHVILFRLLVFILPQRIEQNHVSSRGGAVVSFLWNNFLAKKNRLINVHKKNNKR